MRNAHDTPEAFNIYIINQVGGAAAVAGYYYPFSIFDDNWFIRPWTLCHEMGHSFGLLHTFFTSGECEHAVRTLTPPETPFEYQFNADIAGDQITDTFPYFNSSYSDVNCNYLGGASDCRGTGINSQTINGFFINGSPSNNFMTTESTTVTCNPVFTSQQGLRMRNALNLVPERYDPKRNTIESLYESFETIPILGEITSVTDDGISNGQSIVCRRLSGYIFRYQKGFDYTFNRYGVITNEQVNQIPNYEDFGTFIISQLNSEYEHPFGFVCYRGAQLCTLEPMAGGKIYTTQNLGSTNISTTVLNPQELENPDLINNLPTQTYNIIVKETITGETKTETIFKQN